MANVLLPVVEKGLEDALTEIREELARQIYFCLGSEDCIKLLTDPAEYDETKDHLLILYISGWDQGSWPAWDEVWPNLRGRLEKSSKRAEVLPLHPEGTKFGDVCPPELHNLNGIVFDGTASTSKAIVRRVVRIFGLSEDSRKGFISYRRIESNVLAYQLWSKLHEKGYDVFLDQFSIDYGEELQKRLKERLSECSFLILLETPGIGNSPWVTEEISFARMHGVAIAVVTWPEVAPGARLSTVYDDWRFPAKVEWWNGVAAAAGPRQAFGNQALPEDRLNEVVSFVEDVHQNAMATRRREIDADLNLYLRSKGKSFTINESGHCEVTTQSGNVRFGSVARPPDVKDLWDLCQGQRHGLHRNFLIHPDLPISPERQQLLEWAVEGSSTSFTPAGELPQIIDTL